MQKKLSKSLILLFILHQVRTCQDEVGELKYQLGDTMTTRSSAAPLNATYNLQICNADC